MIGRGIGWISLYLTVAVAPLVFAFVSHAGPGRGFVTEFSVALGFIGLSMMGMQFALVAKFQAVAAPFGEDAEIFGQFGVAGRGQPVTGFRNAVPADGLESASNVAS